MSAAGNWIKLPLKSFQSLRRLNTFYHNGEAEDIVWALKDVSFEIEEGDVIGIIGRNGAGKSTLLKILSRITEPTEGRAFIRGRVSSLLEVGTGFHPDLTGRENVYMNGTILGMTKREIDRKFDEIVAFSGVEKFLDTPIKRFSSGMQVRLAFSVAAHLDPEILIVDEVLAVGDAEFQNKCLGKMKEVARGGRTVLFVSHNMDAVVSLTHHSFLLQGGKIAASGDSASIVRNYLGKGTGLLAEEVYTHSDGVITGARIQSVRLRSLTGNIVPTILPGEAFSIEVEFLIREKLRAQLSIRLNSSDDGRTVLTTAQSDQDYTRDSCFTPGLHRAMCHVPPYLLRPGQYHLLIAMNNFHGPQYDLVERALSFQIESVGSVVNFDNRLGAIAPVMQWTVSKVGANEKHSTASEVVEGKFL